MTKLPISAVMMYLACMPLSSNAGDLYKWTDAQGQVHYGDSPHKGSKRLREDPVPIYAAPRQTEKLSPSQKSPAPNFTGYHSVAIVNPQPDETIWDNDGTLGVSARLEPGLQVELGHQLQFVLDGHPVGDASDGTSMTLTELDRGTHTLSAVVMDSDGKELAQAPAMSFYIKKVSRLQRTENLHGRRR